MNGEVWGGETSLYDRTMAETCHYLSKPIVCSAPSVKPVVRCGLWVEMVCQCRFTPRNQCPSLAWGVASQGGSGARRVWDTLVSSARVCREAKTAQKVKVC